MGILGGGGGGGHCTCESFGLVSIFLSFLLSSSSFSSSAFPALSLGFTIFLCDFCVCDVYLFFLSNHIGSHIMSLWMVHAGCIFVAGIHMSSI